MRLRRLVRAKTRLQSKLRLACSGGARLGGIGSRAAAVCSLVSLEVRSTVGGVLRASGDGRGACPSEEIEFDRVCTCAQGAALVPPVALVRVQLWIKI